MKIAIVNAQAPFVRGGAEALADSLERQLRLAGHHVESVGLPFKWYPPEAIAPQALACRLWPALDADLVIALKFPAYLVPAARKKVWLLHQFRQVYDLWDTPAGDPALHGPTGRWLRERITHADTDDLGRTAGLFTISRTVADRLKRYNGLDADAVLYPPLDRPELFVSGDAADYFFYPSRLNALKRQALAVEAMRHVVSPFRLVIAGAPDAESDRDGLLALIDRHGLHGKVELLGRIGEAEKARLLAHSAGVVFVPLGEDYGYVTVEALQAQRPVVTCRDSGGPTEIVRDGETGLVVEPEAEALAAAMERLWADRALARRLGAAGPARLAELGIAWPHVIERLVA